MMPPVPFAPAEVGMVPLPPMYWAPMPMGWPPMGMPAMQCSASEPNLWQGIVPLGAVQPTGGETLELGDADDAQMKNEPWA